MGHGVQAWGRVTGITVVVGALMLSVMGGGPASAAPEDETAWETGTASTIYDGDTLLVDILESNSGITGTQKVRTIGINAPELFTSPPQCGAQAATDALGSLLPKGTPVQLRSLNGTSYDTDRGRILRSLYAQDVEGNWFDTSRQLVSDGQVFWFPKPTWSVDKPEFAHNLEYRVLAGDAAGASRGLWVANSCGAAPNPGAALRLAVSWESEVDGYEAIMIFNDGAGPVDLSGWIVRDSALNKHTLPAGMVVPAYGSVELRLDAGTDGGGRLLHGGAVRLRGSEGILVRQPSRPEPGVRWRRGLPHGQRWSLFHGQHPGLVPLPVRAGGLRRPPEGQGGHQRRHLDRGCGLPECADQPSGRVRRHR